MRDAKKNQGVDNTTIITGPQRIRRNPSGQRRLKALVVTEIHTLHYTLHPGRQRKLLSVT